MGIDATLFVIAPYSSMGIGFVEHAFELRRDSGLWDKINDLPAIRTWRSIQLPRGSWCAFSDGFRPKNRERSECGYLFRDSYDGELEARQGSALGKLTSVHPLNIAILDFIGRHLGDREVVVFWH